jgi:hypothetical protein
MRTETSIAGIAMPDGALARAATEFVREGAVPIRRNDVGG